MSIEKLQDLCHQYTLITLKKGEAILRPDDPIVNLYCLEEGYVRQYAISQDGDEFALNVYKPGSYFPLALALHRQTNPYYFEAITQVKAYKVPQEEILKFVASHSSAALELLKRLCSGLYGLQLRFESLMFGTAAERVAATLFLSAQRFGNKRKDGKVMIDFPLTHREIAVMTGVTRETVSIEMMKLKKKNVICYKGKMVMINDMKKIEEASSLSQYSE